DFHVTGVQTCALPIYSATAEYERTAYGYPRHGHSGEAAYAALISYRKHEESLEGSARRKWHQEYLDSGLKFADTYPEHPESGAEIGSATWRKAREKHV